LIPSFVLTLAFGSLVFGSAAVADESVKSDPKPIREFLGETVKESFGSGQARPIFDAAVFEDTWKDLRLAKAPGEVDFKNEFAVLVITRGSQIHFRCRDEGEGRLKTLAISTRDIRPGLRYLFGIFSKKEWKQVNETPIP
jgi:hypothetical protein